MGGGNTYIADNAGRGYWEEWGSTQSAASKNRIAALKEYTQKQDLINNEKLSYDKKIENLEDYDKNYYGDGIKPTYKDDWEKNTKIKYFDGDSDYEEVMVYTDMTDNLEAAKKLYGIIENKNNFIKSSIPASKMKDYLKGRNISDGKNDMRLMRFAMAKQGLSNDAINTIIGDDASYKAWADSHQKNLDTVKGLVDTGLALRDMTEDQKKLYYQNIASFSSTNQQPISTVVTPSETNGTIINAPQK